MIAVISDVAGAKEQERQVSASRAQLRTLVVGENT